MLDVHEDLTPQPPARAGRSWCVMQHLSEHVPAATGHLPGQTGGAGTLIRMAASAHQPEVR